MFSIETMEKLYEQLAHMERKHTRDYYDEMAIYREEKDLARRESLLELLGQEQARMEALQYAQGLVMEAMKNKNLWNGSRADKMNMKVWRIEQYKKHAGEA